MSRQLNQTKEYRSFYYDDLRTEPVTDDFILTDAQLENGFTTEILNNLIEEHKETRVPRYMRLKAAYETKYIIFSQDDKPNGKPDNRLAVDMARYICDTFVGFFIGDPPEIRIDDDAQNEWLQNYLKRNDQQDKMADLAEICSMYGQAYELQYQDESGEPASVPLAPISTFIIYDDSVLKRPLYGVRYAYDEDGALTGSYSDADNVYYFETTPAGLKIVGQESHAFGEVPIVEFVENRQKRGVYEGVLNLIDAFNKAISEKANDVDYFADAYLKVTGMELQEDFKENLRDYRLINLWDTGGGPLPDAAFLVKPNADSTQENLLSRLETLIYKESMVPDISDDAFGTASGIALRMRMTPMSNMAAKKDRKFIAALKRKFKLLANYPNQPFRDWQNVEITMKRNWPEDLDSEANLAQALSGIVSEETQLSVLSFVDDPQAELERIEAEKAAKATIATPPGRTASTYEATSLINQYRKGIITKASAISLLEKIGYTQEQAEGLVSTDMQEVASAS